MADHLTGEFILNKNSNSPSTDVSKTVIENSHPHPIYPDIRKNSVGFLTSLCIDPNRVKIASQDSDETIHILVRRHHITNVPWILLVVVLTFLPFTSNLLFDIFPFIRPSAATALGFLMLYYLALFGYVLLKFSEWYFHVGLITNKRLLDIDMASILSKNVAETEIAAVEDVTYIQKGILQSIFNYGTVNIQTEAVTANFEYDRIPHPSQVSEIIHDLAIAARKGGEDD